MWISNKSAGLAWDTGFHSSLIRKGGREKRKEEALTDSRHIYAALPWVDRCAQPCDQPRNVSIAWSKKIPECLLSLRMWLSRPRPHI